MLAGKRCDVESVGEIRYGGSLSANEHNRKRKKDAAKEVGGLAFFHCVVFFLGKTTMNARGGSHCPRDPWKEKTWIDRYGVLTIQILPGGVPKVFEQKADIIRIFVLIFFPPTGKTLTDLILEFHNEDHKKEQRPTAYATEIFSFAHF